MRHELLTLLSSFHFNFQNEGELQQGIAEVLTANGIEFKREYECQLSRWDRPDFIVDGIAIEVKIGGTLNNLLRQIHRYAGFEQVKAVIVITNRSRLAVLPDTVNGKSLSVVLLRSGF